MTAETEEWVRTLSGAGRNRDEEGNIADAPPVDETDDATGAVEQYDIDDDDESDDDEDDDDDDADDEE
jgi:hypothetical protein